MCLSLSLYLFISIYVRVIVRETKTSKKGIGRYILGKCSGAGGQLRNTGYIDSCQTPVTEARLDGGTSFQRMHSRKTEITKYASTVPEFQLYENARSAGWPARR